MPVSPLVAQAPSGARHPCPSLVAREVGVLYDLGVHKEKQVNRNQASRLITISRDSTRMGTSGIWLAEGKEKAGKKGKKKD